MRPRSLPGFLLAFAHGLKREITGALCLRVIGQVKAFYRITIRQKHSVLGDSFAARARFHPVLQQQPSFVFGD